MFCTRCGAEVEDGARFCTSCGAPVEPDGGAEVAPEAPAGPAFASDSRSPQVRPAASDASASAPSPSDTAPIPVVEAPPEPSLYAAPFAPGIRADNRRRSQTRSWVVAGVLAAVAVCAVAVAALTVTGVIGGKAPAAPASSEAAATTASGEVPVRNSIADYSWTELSRIAHQIAETAPDGTDGNKNLQIAQRYHLVDASGELTGQTKDLVLADSRSVPVRLVGIQADVAASGDPAAGLTFVSTAAVAERPMNTSKTSSGGWESSELRAWLNGDFISQLPADLQSALMPVTKPTNNAGETSSASSVTMTTDRVWAPSLVEVGGLLSASDYEAGAGYVADILNNEGVGNARQYQLLSRQGANQDGPSPVLVCDGTSGNPSQWWLRSPSPRKAGRFMSVRADGTPGYGADADETHAVVIGFCL